MSLEQLESFKCLCWIGGGRDSGSTLHISLQNNFQKNKQRKIQMKTWWFKKKWVLEHKKQIPQQKKRDKFDYLGFHLS